jgi:hypothetical protein
VDRDNGTWGDGKDAGVGSIWGFVVRSGEGGDLRWVAWIADARRKGGGRRVGTRARAVEVGWRRDRSLGRGSIFET